MPITLCTFLHLSRRVDIYYPLTSNIESLRRGKRARKKGVGQRTMGPGRFRPSAHTSVGTAVIGDLIQIKLENFVYKYLVLMFRSELSTMVKRPRDNSNAAK